MPVLAFTLAAGVVIALLGRFKEKEFSRSI